MPREPVVHLAWEAGVPLPAFLKGGAMGVVDGRVVYAGGMAYPWRESELVWRLDAEAGWQPGPPLPLGRAYTEGVTVAGDLVVVGGRRSRKGGRVSLADVWRLRGHDWRWQRLPDLVGGRAAASVATDGRKLLVVGGGVWETSQGGAFATRDVDRCEILDLDDLDAGWRDAGPVPGGTRASASCAVLGRRAYLFGGYECWTEAGQRRVRRRRDAWCYDFDADLWTRLDDLPGASSGACAAALAGRWIALIGGALRWRRDGVEVDQTSSHTRHATTPQSRQVKGYSDLVWLYDTRGATWSLQSERLPVGVNDHRCVVTAGRLWVAGGETVDVALSNTTELVSVAVIAGPEEAGVS